MTRGLEESSHQSMSAVAARPPVSLRRLSRLRGMPRTTFEYASSMTRDPSSLHAGVTGSMNPCYLLSLLVKPTAAPLEKSEPAIILRYACGPCNEREGFIKPVQLAIPWFQVCGSHQLQG